ncbi:helix-turn-helix domain-containing protein [Pedobacter sp. UBA4863]|uniref:helix-turn-helix domain-containing protein n=1 Tax=Pedobacter sp. UBA4863 TaxID=1947060 RepID=UPI0025E43F26|nr:helix-turn-helix domain-containing protein [Pedobacter sp. UBA4863]
MGMEIVTKEDLQILRFQLLDDLKILLGAVGTKEDKPEWIKSGEVRQLLKVSPGSLQNLRVSGKLNPVKIQGTWYYRLSEVEGLFKTGEENGRFRI